MILERKIRQVSGKPSNDKDYRILIEFSTEEGLRPVGPFTHKKTARVSRKSNEAINNAMKTIKNMYEHNQIQRLQT